MLMLSGCTGGRFFQVPIHSIRLSGAGTVDIELKSNWDDNAPGSFMIPKWVWAHVPVSALTLNEWWLYDPDSPSASVTQPDWWDVTDTSVGVP